MNKEQIIANLNKEHFEFWQTANYLPNTNLSLNGKWSVSQNVEHINISLFKVSNYLALPKSSIESNYGLSNRESTSNEIIIKVFKNAIENGVKAMDPFIPELNLNKEINYSISQGKEFLISVIENLYNWSEEDLEKYNCPHPFLGNITVREILFFTIYHVQHHHKTLLKM